MDLTDTVAIDTGVASVNPSAVTAAANADHSTTTVIDHEPMEWSVGDRVEVLWEDTNT